MAKEPEQNRPLRLSEKRAEMLQRDGREGVCCIKCGGRLLDVLYTRPTKQGNIKRRRRCRHCGWRFTTIEKPLRKAAKD